MTCSKTGQWLSFFLNSRLENPVFGSNGDAWGEDEEKDYYNDRVGARPPSPPHYSTPPCNLPVSDGQYNSIKRPAREDSFMGFENNFVYDNKGKQLLSLTLIFLLYLSYFIYLTFIYLTLFFFRRHFLKRL